VAPSEHGEAALLTCWCNQVTDRPGPQHIVVNNRRARALPVAAIASVRLVTYALRSMKRLLDIGGLAMVAALPLGCEAAAPIAEPVDAGVTDASRSDVTTDARVADASRSDVTTPGPMFADAGDNRNHPWPSCDWSDELDSTDAGLPYLLSGAPINAGAACRAARTVIVCVGGGSWGSETCLTSDPTQCLDKGSFARGCWNPACSPNEYGVACPGIVFGDSGTAHGVTTGCREIPQPGAHDPSQLRFYCCSCR
jgi:hypothetical protein